LGLRRCSCPLKPPTRFVYLSLNCFSGCTSSLAALDVLHARLQLSPPPWLPKCPFPSLLRQEKGEKFAVILHNWHFEDIKICALWNCLGKNRLYAKFLRISPKLYVLKKKNILLLIKMAIKIITFTTFFFRCFHTHKIIKWLLIKSF